MDCSSDATLEGCLVIGASGGEGLYVQDNSLAVLTCTDIWGNALGDWIGPIAGQLGQNGNICLDPRFCDPGNLDFTLAADSPCVPDAIPGCGLVGAWPVGCDWPLDAGPGAVTPAALVLAPAAPNPFNPETTLRFAIPAAGRVRLEIYALDGRRVATLVDESLAAGDHTAVWDGRDGAGRAVPSGPYVSRLTTGGGSVARSLTVVK